MGGQKIEYLGEEDGGVGRNVEIYWSDEIWGEDESSKFLTSSYNSQIQF